MEKQNPKNSKKTTLDTETESLTNADKTISALKLIKFASVGFTSAAIDYAIYEVIVLLFFKGNIDMAGVSAIISGITSTFVAYFLHSRITWKTRDPGKYGIIKFFIWNILVVVFLRPFLTFFFGLFTGVHQFVYVVVGWIPLFSSFNFVQTTTIYVLMTLVTMTLNFIFYEKIVFGSKKEGENVDMKRIRKPREKEQRKSKADKNS